MLKYIATWLTGAWLLTCATAAPPPDGTAWTFRLESAQGGEPLGPFLLRDDQRLPIGGDFYGVTSPLGDDLEFVSERTGLRFGPFDFVDGRIVRLHDQMYTLRDIRTVSLPSPARAVEPPAPQPLPAPPENIIPPLVERPSPTPPPQITPAPVTPPQIAPAPVAPPQIAPAPVAPPQITPAPEAARVPRPAPTTSSPPLRDPPRLEHKRRTPVSVGAGVRVFEAADFDIEANVEAESVPFKRTTALSRHGVFARVAVPHVAISAGYSFEAKMDDALDTGFVAGDVSLSDGSGWWAAVDVDYPVWRRGRWTADLVACASYRNESYTMGYSAWDSAPLLLIGTNELDEAAEPELVWSLVDSHRSFTASELFVDSGAEIAYSARAWQVYAGCRILLLSNVDATDRFETEDGIMQVDLERAGNRVTATAGLRTEAAGLKWFGEARFGAEQSVNVGFLREF